MAETVSILKIRKKTEIHSKIFGTIKFHSNELTNQNIKSKHMNRIFRRDAVSMLLN